MSGHKISMYLRNYLDHYPNDKKVPEIVQGIWLLHSESGRAVLEFRTFTEEHRAQKVAPNLWKLSEVCGSRGTLSY